MKHFRLCYSKSKLIYFQLHFGYYVAKFLGIIPFSIRRDQQQQDTLKRKLRIRKSYKWRIYCCIIFALAACSLPLAMLSLYKRMHFLQQNPLIAFVGYNRYLLQMCFAVFTIFMQLSRDDSIIELINELLACQQHKHVQHADFDMRAVLLLCMKLLNLLPAMSWSLFILIHDDAIDNADLFFSVLFVCYCNIVMQMALNMFFVGMLLLQHCARQLNRQLRMLLRQTLHVARNRQRRTMQLLVQQCCFFTEGFEHLMQLHARLIRLADTLTRLYEFQMLAFLVFVLSECVVQLFFIYFVGFSGREPPPPPPQSSSDENVATNNSSMAMHSEGPPASKSFLNPYALAFITGMLLDMMLVIWSAEEMKRCLSLTRSVLAEGNLQLQQKDIAIRLCRSLEHFSLYLRKQKISCSTCGLFSLDQHLLLRIFETVLMYLLILIQFDMIFNRH